MSRSEQNVVREMCQTFLHDAVPEYIRDTAYYILSEGGVQKINIQEGETWEAQGVIQGEDLQVYTPSLTFSITDRSTRHQCNCSESFTSTCRHVAALALRLLEELRKEQGDAEEVTPPAKDWKQSFRSFFSTDMEPEPGKHYLIFRFQPEQGRLLVSFFRGRQNKSGLSSVHNEITLQQIINNPDWCEFSPQLPHVARQIGQHLDYYGHRVEIPDGLTSWFFWAVRKEYYLLWKDTDRPCRIESTPFALKLKPNFDDNGFSFDVLLKREGRPPLPIRANGAPSDHLHGAEAPEDAPITFHGQMPLWVCYQHNFYPVQTGLYPSLVHNLIYERPVVPQEEISEFLDRVWTRLPSSALYEPQQFLRMMEPVFQPATYNPKLFLDEEGSLLTLEIDNIYQTRHGEFTLNGPNPDFQTGSYTYEGQTYLVRRHQEEEAQLMNELAGMDFQARSSKLWFLEPEEAIAFLLDSYPTLVENYRVYGERALSRYKMRTAKSTISAEVVSNEKEKWFSLEISVDYEGQSLPLDKIWKAWTRGKRYVQLKDGSYTSLPESWLEKIAHKLTALGLDPSKPPQTKFKQFEAPVLDSLLEDLPGARTDSFWNNLREKIRSFREVRPVPPPKALQASLRSYQLQGLSYLNFLSEYGFGGILADEMGLGKTVQTLAFIQHMVESRFEGPNLIVVPTSVLPNWEREAEKFVPGLRRLTIYGTRREGMFKHIAESDLIITTYALLRRDLEEMEKYEFNTVILDEPQHHHGPRRAPHQCPHAPVPFRYAHREQPFRALEPVRVPHARLPRFAACLPARHRQAHQGRRRRDPGLPAHPRAALHPAPYQGRSGQGPAAQGGERHLLRAGRGPGRALRRPGPQAARPGAGRRGRKGPGQEPDVHPGRPAQAAPDLLPSAPAQDRPARLLQQPALRQVRRLQGHGHGDRGRRPQGAGLFAVRADAPDHPPVAGVLADPLLLSGRRQQGPLRTGGPLQQQPGHPHLPHLAQGGRHGPEPDQRGLRHPLRPVVEPRRGKPGHGPHPPHRPDAAGVLLQAHLPEHGGREDPQAAGSQAWRGRGHHPRSGHLEVPDPRGSGDALRSLDDTATNSVITRRGSRALPRLSRRFPFSGGPTFPPIRAVRRYLRRRCDLPAVTPHPGENTARPAAIIPVPPPSWHAAPRRAPPLARPFRGGYASPSLRARHPCLSRPGDDSFSGRRLPRRRRMDEAAPFTPRTLLWRGTRCLRNESPSLRPCGLRRLCRLFGIDLAARRREADLVLSVFAGLAPRHGLDKGLAPLAVLVHTLVELGDGTPDAGEIVLTHPLKRLDADANRLLAMTLTLLTVGKGRTDKVEPLLTGMGCAPDDPRRRTAVVLAAIVQVARFALRFDPLEIRLPGEPPVLFLIRVRTPLRLRKQLVIHAPLWERLFGKSSLEWFWTFEPDADTPVPAQAPPAGQLFSSHFSAYLQRQARALHALARSDSALDEEAIHDARVILRSLLSVFGSLRPYLRKDWLAAVDPDLRAARKLLGGVRDTDVLLGHIKDYALRPVPADAAGTAAASGQAPEGAAPLFRPEDLPAGLRGLHASLQRERATALARAAAHYASDAYRELLHKLDDNDAARTCRPALDRRGRARPMLLADIMAAGVDQAVRNLLAHDRWTHGHLIPEDLLHNMRIAFKQLRYLMAFFGSQGGKNGERLIRLCRRCQESLGQMHDNAVAAATALRHLQRLPQARRHAADADGLEEYARWCEEEMHRHAMSFLTDWTESGRDELCRLARRLSPSAGDTLPLLRPGD